MENLFVSDPVAYHVVATLIACLVGYGIGLSLVWLWTTHSLGSFPGNIVLFPRDKEHTPNPTAYLSHWRFLLLVLAMVVMMAGMAGQTLYLASLQPPISFSQANKAAIVSIIASVIATVAMSLRRNIFLVDLRTGRWYKS